MVGKLSVEHLLGGRVVKRIESGGTDKGLGDDPSPGVPEAEQTDALFRTDGFSDEHIAVFELCQDCPVQVEVAPAGNADMKQKKSPS